MDNRETALITYEDLAKKIDYSLVRPELNEETIVAGCKLARKYNVASVAVRPSDIELAVGLLGESDVRVGSIAGFPHGSQNTAAKLYETRDLLRRGAEEIDLVINIGKLVSRQFQYIEVELLQAAEACHENDALLKVIFENAYLTDDLKIVACKICKRTGVDFAKTSTGFAPTGATATDVRLMVEQCGSRVQVKAAGGIGSLDQALEFCGIGCTRIGTSSAGEILDGWKQRLAQQAKSDAAS